MTSGDARSGSERKIGVSRETLGRLDTYEALLRKWNPTINLVAKSTLGELWNRHFLDSAQIFALANPQGGTWADLGSGGGFPGLVVALIAAERAPTLAVTLVESDARKAAFLVAAARECGVRARVVADRIEATPPLFARYLSARALAPLSKLLEYTARHLAADGVAYLSKGSGWRDEVAAARRIWHFDATAHPSMTDANSAILEIKGVARA